MPRRPAVGWPVERTAESRDAQAHAHPQPGIRRSQTIRHVTAVVRPVGPLDTIQHCRVARLIITVVQIAEILQAVAVTHTDIARLHDVIQVTRRGHHLPHVARPRRDRNSWCGLGIPGQHRAERDRHEHALVMVRLGRRARTGDVVAVGERIPCAHFEAGTEAAFHLEARSQIARKETAAAHRRRHAIERQAIMHGRQRRDGGIVAKS